jgi:hypothetical protein
MCDQVRAFLPLSFLPSAAFSLDLISASNDFEVQMIDREHILEQNPSATELAASTLKYAKAKERYYVELRKSVPILIDTATGNAPKTPELDRLLEIFSGYGETQAKQLKAATVSMLKRLLCYQLLRLLLAALLVSLATSQFYLC